MARRPRSEWRPTWFLAVPVPAGAWWSGLMKKAPRKLWRTHPADLHITVAFLGECDERAARSLWHHIPAGGPFRVRLREVQQIGYVPGPGGPRDAFAAKITHTPMTDYIRAVRAEVARHEPAMAERWGKVSPHVTLGSAPVAEFDGFEWSWVPPFLNEVLDLNVVGLYRSADTNTGRRFVKVADRSTDKGGRFFGRPVTLQG